MRALRGAIVLILALALPAPVLAALSDPITGPPCDATTLEELRPLAEQGDTDAQNKLGLIYERSCGDGAEAAKWYRMAAEQGDTYAQNKLGYLYFVGKGVTQNYAEAVKWYRLAAEQGHLLAQSKLGYMYNYGEGIGSYWKTVEEKIEGGIRVRTTSKES